MVIFSYQKNEHKYLWYASINFMCPFYSPLHESQKCKVMVLHISRFLLDVLCYYSTIHSSLKKTSYYGSWSETLTEAIKIIKRIHLISYQNPDSIRKIQTKHPLFNTTWLICQSKVMFLKTPENKLVKNNQAQASLYWVYNPDGIEFYL